MSAALLERPLAANPAVSLGDTPDILASILDPEVQLALWQRDRPAALHWLDTLEWDGIDDVADHITGPDFSPDISRLLDEAGYPKSSQAETLANEIAQVAARFAELMTCDRLRLRLEVIETDACRKFHMDYVKTRLLMPLVGPGTQWIECTDGEQAPVNQLACSDVGIFKGRLSVDEPAILHRSPPVAASGESRLLLVLDPVSDHADHKALELMA